MSTYSKLDAAIIDAARVNRHPLYYIASRSEAERIAQATGREEFRVIDARMRALVKAGRIVYRNRAWHAVEPEAA
jgi:hypothetical protein